MSSNQFDKWIKHLVHDEHSSNAENKKPYINKQKKPRFLSSQHSRPVLRVIPLGGLNEVGKNMMVFEYGNDIVIVDMGFQFPEEDMLGIDYVVPDISYLQDKKHHIRGVFLTHGHLDHIGAIPYLIPKLGRVTFYGMPLTLGFVKKRLEEFHLEHHAILHKIDPAHDVIHAGSFKVDFFRVNHSIPDSMGIRLTTPVGAVVHTGDFKFDFTPADKTPSDITKMAAIGDSGILALFSDSTNAVKQGFTMSEKQIGENLDRIIEKAEGRIIIASFASLIGRIQQIIDSAIVHKRKVFVSGKSMDDNIRIAMNLDYIKAPRGFIRYVKNPHEINDDRAVVITTGGQGEAFSALTKISLNEHRYIKIKYGDTVVISSNPIPGNERAIVSVINNLCKKGAKVVFNQIMDVHTSGHGQQEELKLMMNLIKPKYLIPVHGEYFMRRAHAEIGNELGIKKDNILVVENGDVLEFYDGKVQVLKEAVQTDYIMVESGGVGDVTAQIMLERQIMAENGIVVMFFKIAPKTNVLYATPQVLTRGFIYMKTSQHILDTIAKLGKEAYEEILKNDNDVKKEDIKSHIKGEIDKYVHEKLAKTPLIIPILIYS